MLTGSSGGVGLLLISDFPSVIGHVIFGMPLHVLLNLVFPRIGISDLLNDQLPLLLLHLQFLQLFLLLSLEQLLTLESVLQHLVSILDELRSPLLQLLRHLFFPHLLLLLLSLRLFSQFEDMVDFL